MITAIVTMAENLKTYQYIPIKLAIDLILWTLATPLAFLLRLGDNLMEFGLTIAVLTVVAMPIKAIAIVYLGLHRQSWHKVSTRDLMRLIEGTALVTVVLFAAAFLLSPLFPIPRSIPIIDSILAICLLGGIRLMLRTAYEHSLDQQNSVPKRRLLIVGAGEAGTLTAREMLRHPESGLAPVGYLDDEPSKRRQSFLGLPVLGSISDLPKVVEQMQIEEVVIAIPSASGDVIRRVVDLAREAEVRHRIVPGFYDIVSGDISISAIRDVDVEDLLRRDPIQLDMKEISAYIEDFVVMVTGAGGSIGSEIVRQAIRFDPKKVVLLDRNENALYMFKRELENQQVDVPCELVIADIQNHDKLDALFQHYKPQVVFHAAANKHVPLMEAYPEEAILNNVVGTRNVAELALEHGVGRFVNISTDKAVNPTSVMGASKRIAEMLVSSIARRASEDKAFVSVRFGNVLGSNGSVVPIFRDQIRAGGPITVTHEDITRYFMSIPEATQLVLQAAGLGQNDMVYILDMGEPVRILDLARDLIELSGLKPDEDIKIEITGLRPGEKLYEELLTAEEGTLASKHDKIFIVQRQTASLHNVETIYAQLLSAAKVCNAYQIRTGLKQAIPTYKPKVELFVAS